MSELLGQRYRGGGRAKPRVLIAKEHLFATQQVGKQNMFLGEPDVAEINLFPIAARVFKCRRAGDACRALPLELCCGALCDTLVNTRLLD